ncbi:hypothetical protein [Gluconobacter kanchanaburiensis]|uniref:Uncharacterized protein n=1 Tax=Gluconobacter kanchanaburiensis NBRC 103587 TaxID=1307948 RepID=A0A511B375_9PROT|nr:hypothetical protein [Gluconobacter kanchanaburiensis]MBF0860926.1 hypothetical protein [Gluconobacter kanchanaburiensis]GBR70060.1 hypothetical protein AA103587_1666 [Gluconobacter kanchanaburiensis NBRC 103587]GEK94895.1 hypothetical protein GKA01_00920 [Gluconobacter kanchanaburiensis NBRC 103587]
MSIKLDPMMLPALDILGMAQSGAVLRAERETPSDGIPAFVTRSGWDELVATHASDHTAPHTVLLPAMEKAVTRLLSHAAEAASRDGVMAPTITIQSDLFLSDPDLVLAFVRDITHPVACALIGTAAQIETTLRAHTPVHPLPN